MPFQKRQALTTLADVAKAQTERIGKRIRERRDELELNQRQLAALLPESVDAQAVSKWERAIHRPSDDNLEALARALETDESDLIAGPVSERKPRSQSPDLMGSLNGDSEDTELARQLQRVELKLDRVLQLLNVEPIEEAEEAAAEGDELSHATSSPPAASKAKAPVNP